MQHDQVHFKRFITSTSENDKIRKFYHIIEISYNDSFSCINRKRRKTFHPIKF